MAANIDTRRHEAAHAICAIALDVGVCDEAMVLISDQEAGVNTRAPDSTPDEDWYVRRVAVKLAGPIMMMRGRGQLLELETMESNSEYAKDYSDAQRILQRFWSAQGYAATPERIKKQLVCSAALALKVVDQNIPAIEALVAATESLEFFSRDQILHAIEGHLQKVKFRLQGLL